MIGLRASRALDLLFFRGLARLLRLLHLLHGLPDFLLGLLQGLLGLFDFLLLERRGGCRGARGLDAAAGEGRRCDQDNKPCHVISFRGHGRNRIALPQGNAGSRDQPSFAVTASANCRVPIFPPRSAVRVAGFFRVASTAASMFLAAPANALLPWRAAIHSSSIAAERMSEVGFARSLPAMSGAEPCWACATQYSSPALIEPPRPRPPESSEASSERMSPYMFSATITSKRIGSRSSSAAIASTMISSSCTWGKSCATLRTSRRYSPSEIRNTFALCTAVTFLRRIIAASKPRRAMRSQHFAVTRRTASAMSSVGMNSPMPAYMLRSA